MEQMQKKKRQSLDSVIEDDFQAISLYFTSGQSPQLTGRQQLMLERMRTAHAVLRRYPRKSVAVQKLMARFQGLSREQAYRDVRNACRLWNSFDPIDREFIEGWFLDWLMKEIADPASSDQARAKNLATLQRYLSQLPPERIDPHLMESNQVYIQFNVSGRCFNIPEQVLAALPPQLRQQLLSGVGGEIDEAGAVQILES